MIARELTRAFRPCVAVDLRSLALYRISLALILIYDLVVQKLPHVRMLYTEQGVMPSVGLDRIFGSSFKWTTLHYWSDDFVVSQQLMLLVALLAAVALLVGYRTWIALFLSWLLFVSLNRRLPLSGSGADTTLRILMFWSLWLPLGHRFSIDSVRRQTSVSSSHVSVATAGFILQLCYIYWFTAIYKLQPDWLNGSAIGHSLRLDFIVTPFGRWLEQFDNFTVLLTYMTLLGEAFLPMLLFTPVLTVPARLLVIFAMFSFHIGIALCMNLGFYPAAMLAGWLVLLPTEAWDGVFAWLARKNEAPEAATRLRFGSARPVRSRFARARDGL